MTINNDEEMIRILFSKRKITSTDCWEWTGSISGNGYGNAYYLSSQWGVHRLSFFLFKRSKWKPNILILHKCNNSICFNPDHLYIGDAFCNTKDAIRDHKGGAWLNSQKTHCSRGHEYTPENIFLTTKGSRVCRICKNEMNRNYRRHRI